MLICAFVASWRWVQELLQAQEAAHKKLLEDQQRITQQLQFKAQFMQRQQEAAMLQQRKFFRQDGSPGRPDGNTVPVSSTAMWATEQARLAAQGYSTPGSNHLS